MNNKRSIEAQRARLLGKKPSSKPMSDKFVKKEIVNIKYGIKKTPQTSKPLPRITIFFISFFVILLPTVLIMPIIFAIALASMFGFVIARFMPEKKNKPALNIKNYHLQNIFIDYESIMTDSMRNHVININDLMHRLSAQELNPKEAYYVESNMLRDIPGLFKNFKELATDLESQQKTVEALSLIENKLKIIHDYYGIDYKRNLEIKKRVIVEKSMD